MLAGPTTGTFMAPEIDPDDIVAYKPVIYFHGEGNGTTKVNIDFNATDIITIPPADVSQGTIDWEISLEDNSDDTTQMVIKSDQKINDFLFYEGNKKRGPDIVAEINIYNDSILFSIRNIVLYRLENIYFWQKIIQNNQSRIILFQLYELKSNEYQEINVSKSSSIEVCDIKENMESDLTNNGLTKNEANDLLTYWVDGYADTNGIQADRTWFEGDEEFSSGIIYTIPQHEYDKFIPIVIDPAPQNVIRVGLIYIYNIPTNES